MVTKKRFGMSETWLGVIEVAAAPMLVLTGYAAGRREWIWALLVPCLYTTIKNVVERGYVKRKKKTP